MFFSSKNEFLIGKYNHSSQVWLNNSLAFKKAYAIASQNTISFKQAHFNLRDTSVHFWNLRYNNYILLLYLTLPFPNFLFSYPILLDPIFPHRLCGCWSIDGWTAGLSPVENPRDEPNLPSAVAIRQCKASLVVVLNLSSFSYTPLFFLMCNWNLPWDPTFVT